MKNIKSSISSVLFNIGGDRYHDLIVIALSWKTVVGSFMAEHSSLIKYQNNTLYVGVDSSVWLQEFVLMKTTIIKKLNKVIARDVNSKINNLVFLLSEKKMIKVSPSILSADFANLKQDLTAVIKAGSDLLHIDVMDGHYVPNLTFGNPVIERINTISTIPLDVHLMVTNPSDYYKFLANLRVAMISFHPATVHHLHREIYKIKELGIKAGLALNPGDSLSLIEEVLSDIDFILIMSVNPGYGGQSFISNTYHKIEKLNKIRQENNLTFKIEIDGGVNDKNAPKLIEAGADIFVAGSYIFKSNDYASAINSLK